MRQDIKDTIKEIMKKEGLQQDDLLVALNYKSRQQVSQMMNQKDIKLENFLSILHACNCELVIKHNNVEYHF